MNSKGKKSKKVWKIVELLQWITDDFKKRDIDTPRLDAELILSHALGLDRVGLYINFDRPLTKEELERVRELVKRRRKREPISYITGKKEFYGLELIIRPGVLIPRPETELLVEAVLKYSRSGAKILEIGSGSGAISVALGINLKEVQITTIDKSRVAFEVTKENIAKYKLEDKVKVYNMSMEEFFKTKKTEFDIVVSNPPYIPTKEIDTLAPEIRLYEPREAIDGGEDGLFFIKKLLEGVGSVLKKGGHLIIEFGDGELEGVKLLFKKNNFEIIEVVKDLAKLDRVIVGQRG